MNLVMYIFLQYRFLYFLEFHSAYKIKQIANATARMKNHCGTPPKLMLTPRSKIFIIISIHYEILNAPCIGLRPTVIHLLNEIMPPDALFISAIAPITQRRN